MQSVIFNSVYQPLLLPKMSSENRIRFKRRRPRKCTGEILQPQSNPKFFEDQVGRSRDRENFCAKLILFSEFVLQQQESRSLTKMSSNSADRSRIRFKRGRPRKWTSESKQHVPLQTSRKRSINLRTNNQAKRGPKIYF